MLGPVGLPALRVNGHRVNDQKLDDNEEASRTIYHLGPHEVSHRGRHLIGRAKEVH